MPNKASRQLRALALKYTKAAMAEIGRLSVEAESEEVRVKAAAILFERAAGKVPQPIVGDDDSDPISVKNVHELSDEQLAAIAISGGAGASDPPAGEG